MFEDKKTAFYVFVCFLAIFAIILIYLHDELNTWFSGRGVYSEIHLTYYRLSDDCIEEFFNDKLNEDGMIFISDQLPLPEGCALTVLGNDVIIIDAHQSEEETHQLSMETYTKMKGMGANLLYIDEVITRIPKLDEDPIEFNSISPEKHNV